MLPLKNYWNEKSINYLIALGVRYFVNDYVKSY